MIRSSYVTQRPPINVTVSFEELRPTARLATPLINHSMRNVSALYGVNFQQVEGRASINVKFGDNDALAEHAGKAPLSSFQSGRFQSPCTKIAQRRHAVESLESGFFPDGRAMGVTSHKGDFIWMNEKQMRSTPNFEQTFEHLLAHEGGHALGLSHVDRSAEPNIMHQTSTGRQAMVLTSEQRLLAQETAAKL